MNWTYSLERLPAEDSSNQHTVQVVSGPRDVKEDMKMRFWTNLEHHAVEVSKDSPIIIFAEIKLGQSPVVDAGVTAEILSINQSGFLTPLYQIPLYDNGNGDPDLRAQDGIYSRYLTHFPGGEGRYTVNIKVDDNYGKAFAPMKTFGDSRSCCQDKSFLKISNQKLGSFSRIMKGDSFRIHSISKGSLPPSRIMNLAVDVLTASQQLEFSWTSPGDDFDSGKPTSYQLFYSDHPGNFYNRRSKAKLVESFSASKSAGHKESKKITVDYYDKNLHFALLAVDKEGNLGELSNVVKAYMPSPIIAEDAVKTSPHSSGQLGVSGEALPSDKRQILLYLIVGIVGVIFLVLLIVTVIILSFRRKKIPEDVSIESNKSDGTSTDNNGFSVTSDDMENMSRDQEAKHFLLGNSGQDSIAGPGPIHSSLIQDASGSVTDNPYGTYSSSNAMMNRSYGWSATTNPYVYKDSNETYASIASFHNSSQDSYIRGNYQPQPTYAQPIPKNLRPQHIYSNAAVIARHSPQTSITAASPGNSADGSRGTVTFVAATEPPILRASPDSQSSETNAPTPTKSILKKPKHHNVTDCGLDMTSDRESQSSQASSVHGKEEAVVRSPSATDTVSSQQSQVSTITTNEEMNLSIEKTYLETSFEFSPLNAPPHHTKEEAENAANCVSAKKLPPPTLPKPRALNNQDIILSSDNLSNSLDKKIRNCTQV